MPRPSELTALPKAVPIDWFDPTYWNEHLTLREHADYIQEGVYVALPKAELCGTWSVCGGWKNLPVAEFMEKYGNEVLAQYKLPTQEEIEQLDQYDEDEDEGEQEDGGDDEL